MQHIALLLQLWVRFTTSVTFRRSTPSAASKLEAVSFFANDIASLSIAKPALCGACLLFVTCCAGDLDDSEVYDRIVVAPVARAANGGDGSALDAGRRLRVLDGAVLPSEFGAPKPRDDSYSQSDDDSTPEPSDEEEPGPRCEAVELDGCPEVPTQIFATACGTENCHGNAEQAPRGFTDLGHSVDDITERLLDLPGTEGEACENHKVVDTENPEQSLLITKLQPIPPCGLNMPFGVYQIGEHEVACIERWVHAVANEQTIEVPCRNR